MDMLIGSLVVLSAGMIITSGLVMHGKPDSSDNEQKKRSINIIRRVLLYTGILLLLLSIILQKISK